MHTCGGLCRPLAHERFLQYWITYVFPNENEEKVYMYLHEIRNRFPKANLYKTLRALAFRMRPTEKTSIDDLPKRKQNLMTMIVAAITAGTAIMIAVDLIASYIKK